MWVKMLQMCCITYQHAAPSRVSAACGVGYGKGRDSVSGATPLFLALPCTANLCLLGGSHTLLGDAGLLAGEVAQIVQLGTAYLAYLVHCDAVDAG